MMQCLFTLPWSAGGVATVEQGAVDEDEQGAVDDDSGNSDEEAKTLALVGELRAAQEAIPLRNPAPQLEAIERGYRDSRNWHGGHDEANFAKRCAGLIARFFANQDDDAVPKLWVAFVERNRRRDPTEMVHFAKMYYEDAILSDNSAGFFLMRHGNPTGIPAVEMIKILQIMNGRSKRVLTRALLFLLCSPQMIPALRLLPTARVRRGARDGVSRDVGTRGGCRRLALGCDYQGPEGRDATQRPRLLPGPRRSRPLHLRICRRPLLLAPPVGERCPPAGEQARHSRAAAPQRARESRRLRGAHPSPQLES